MCCVVDIEIDDVSTSLSQIFINFTNNFPQKIQQKKKNLTSQNTRVHHIWASYWFVFYLYIFLVID